MQMLFPGEPEPLPAHQGPTWTVSSGDPRKPPPVRHALGYAPFVAFAEQFGTDARALFDIWTFAHFVRAHRQRFDEDSDLLHAAVVFLGNVFIANHPDCSWTNNAPGLAVEFSPEPELGSEPQVVRKVDGYRYIGVGGTVPALLAADEMRLLEFQTVVDRWKPGAPAPRIPLIGSRSRAPGSD